MSRGIAVFLALAACTGGSGKDTGQEHTGGCEEAPEDRAVPEGYAAACETADDCPADFACELGAAGGYYYFYELTCTPLCETDDDCPVVVSDASCGEGPYCTMVQCGALGYCIENTCA